MKKEIRMRVTYVTFNSAINFASSTEQALVFINCLQRGHVSPLKLLKLRNAYLRTTHISR